MQRFESDRVNYNDRLIEAREKGLPKVGQYQPNTSQYESKVGQYQPIDTTQFRTLLALQSLFEKKSQGAKTETGERRARPSNIPSIQPETKINTDRPTHVYQQMEPYKLTYMNHSGFIHSIKDPKKPSESFDDLSPRPVAPPGQWEEPSPRTNPPHHHTMAPPGEWEDPSPWTHPPKHNTMAPPGEWEDPPPNQWTAMPPGEWRDQRPRSPVSYETAPPHDKPKLTKEPKPRQKENAPPPTQKRQPEVERRVTPEVPAPRLQSPALPRQTPDDYHPNPMFTPDRPLTPEDFYNPTSVYYPDPTPQNQRTPEPPTYSPLPTSFPSLETHQPVVFHAPIHPEPKVPTVSHLPIPIQPYRPKAATPPRQTTPPPRQTTPPLQPKRAPPIIAEPLLAAQLQPKRAPPIRTQPKIAPPTKPVTQPKAKITKRSISPKTRYPIYRPPPVTSKPKRALEPPPMKYNPPSPPLPPFVLPPTRTTPPFRFDPFDPDLRPPVLPYRPPYSQRYISPPETPPRPPYIPPEILTPPMSPLPRTPPFPRFPPQDSLFDPPLPLTPPRSYTPPKSYAPSRSGLPPRPELPDIFPPSRPFSIEDPLPEDHLMDPYSPPGRPLPAEPSPARRGAYPPAPGMDRPGQHSMGTVMRSMAMFRHRGINTGNWSFRT